LKPVRMIACMILVVCLSACGRGQPLAPTLTATSSNTPTPANTPTPTMTPTSTPTLTPSPVPDGPCDNPLVPLGAGNQWTYRVTTPNGESYFNLASLDIQSSGNIVAALEYADQKNNLTIRDSVICHEGAIVNYPLFVLNMLLTEYLDAYIDTNHVSVDYAPSYQTLTQNNWIMDWTAKYSTEDEAFLRNPAEGPNLYIAFPTDIQLFTSMDGKQEAVSVSAGDFPQALKVSQSYLMPVTLLMGGSNSGSAAALKINTTQWYEPYTGLVRAQIDSMSLDGAPAIPRESTLELVEFTPGK
jgi:hypothetical protein